MQDLYSLITLSHTKRIFKNPTLFRSDIIKFRKNLLVGASGGVNGEIFDIFSTFKTETEREKKISFFDYVELYNPDSLKHLWLNGSIEETKFQKTIKKIIDKARKCSVPVIASNNVHYTKKEEEVLKRILVAHKSNGSSHSLYSDATWNSKANRFFILPQQHLLSLAEILEKWSFLSEEELLEELIFSNHEKLLRDIEDISIDSLKIDYSKDEGLAEKKEELVKAYKNKADYLFGKNWPSFVHSRIKKEWEIIEKKYTFVYWLTYKIAQKAQKENFIIGSRGSVGSSFLAFLCGITDLNPLPFYKYCKICRHCEIYEADSRDFSCYDYREKELCGSCLESGLNSYLSIEGHNLPQSTFFGLDGKKTPDIDLNFSGEKQKEVHTLIMKMLGEKRAVRAGTISTVSQQTAEIIYSSYRKLTQSLDSRKLKETNLENSSNEWQQKYWKDLLQKNYSFEKIESSWDPSHSDEIIDALNEKFKELEFLKKELEREKNESLEN